jgi:hypothetical protein
VLGGRHEKQCEIVGTGLLRRERDGQEPSGTGRRERVITNRWSGAIIALFALGCGGSHATVPPAAQVHEAQVDSTSYESRALSFNGQPLRPEQYGAAAQLEGNRGVPLPDGDYWYDSASGALGHWQGHTLEFVTAGLDLGPMPAHASGTGTNIFLNGREVHPIDVQRLSELVGRDVPLGRYWMDAEGNAGPEGGGALLNLFAELEQRGGVPQLGAGTPDNPAPRPH